MTLELGCKDNPVELGLVDKEGNWDMEKFEQHVEFCLECQKCMEAAERLVRDFFRTEIESNYKKMWN